MRHLRTQIIYKNKQARGVGVGNQLSALGVNVN
jgi:hypothetical protein